LTGRATPARWPWELLALPALGLAYLFPETGAGLYVRLAAATLCLLLPGALVSRAFGEQSVSATLVWSLAGLAAASALMFAVEGPLWWALVVYAGMGAVALPFAVMRPLRRPTWFALGVAVAGVAFGIALWAIAGQLDGDALFHLARIRKLEAFDNLTLESVDEFVDGGLHPGYAFPLWHVLMGLVAWVAGVDAGDTLLHEPSVLCPVAFLVAYEAGVAILRTTWAGLAALLAAVALTGLAPGRGGAYTVLSLPASSSRHLLVPATVATFFVFVHKPGWAAGLTAAAASLALALVHPTYAIFVAVPLVGYALARSALARGELGRNAAGLAFVLVPAAAVGAWLAPLVRDTASHNPSVAERARGLAHYPGQVDVFSPDSFRLAPEMLGRPGAVAIAALAAVPLAALASRRRWSAYVLGGSVALLAILLLPELFTRFSDTVSLSQARRAAGFVPLAAAFAGGAAVLARLVSWWAVPAALAAGIALELAYPGEFSYLLKDGGPPIVAWLALVGGAVALLVAAVLGKRGALDDRGPLSAVVAGAFVLPVAIFGFGHWDAATYEPSPLTRALVARLAALPDGSVVFSDDSTSYWVASVAPLYVASARPGHVADTEKNRPYERRDDANRFGRTGDVSIPRRYQADFVLVQRDRWPRIELALPIVYRDGRYVLYRL
jgi:hypothetical protein